MSTMTVQSLPESTRLHEGGPLRRTLVVTLVFMLLAVAAAQSSGSPEADRFLDRWLRAFAVQSIAEIPRFEGAVAEVTRTTSTGGEANERRLWSFDERGWPTSTTLTAIAGGNEFTYVSTWHYGSDGLPSTIEIGGRQANLLFLSWGDSTVEVTSDIEDIRYSYDVESDVLTVEQTAPNEVRRTFAFNDDGSYHFSFEQPAEGGGWTLSASGTADSHNLRTSSTTAVIAIATEVSERDPSGNPLAATSDRSGRVSGTSSLAWDVVYR